MIIIFIIIIILRDEQNKKQKRISEATVIYIQKFNRERGGGRERDELGHFLHEQPILFNNYY